MNITVWVVAVLLLGAAALLGSLKGSQLAWARQRLPSPEEQNTTHIL